MSGLCHHLLFLRENDISKTGSAGFSSHVKKQGYASLTLQLKIQTDSIFTFMLPCFVIDFLLNNQPDAPIIQVYSVIKPHMFRASSFAHHQEFSTVYSALLSFMQVLMTALQFHPDSAWTRSSKTCMKLTSAESTGSWWWTETMPKTCGVL
jgi:hypothetical protein